MTGFSMEKPSKTMPCAMNSRFSPFQKKSKNRCQNDLQKSFQTQSVTAAPPDFRPFQVRLFMLGCWVCLRPIQCATLAGTGHAGIFDSKTIKIQPTWTKNGSKIDAKSIKNHQKIRFAFWERFWWFSGSHFPQKGCFGGALFGAIFGQKSKKGIQKTMQKSMPKKCRKMMPN